MSVSREFKKGESTGRWIVEVKHGGRRHRRTVGGSEENARRVEASLKEHGGRAPKIASTDVTTPKKEVAPLSLWALSDQCVATQYLGKDRRYIQCQQTYQRRFIHWAYHGHGIVSLADIDVRILELWKAYVSDKFAKSPSGINQHLTAVYWLLTWGVKCGLLKEFPRAKRQSAKRVRLRRALGSHEELAQLVGALRAVGAPAVANLTVAAVYTGLRLGNLLAARPEWLHATPKGATLALPQTKTGGRQLIPLHPDTAALLKASLPWGISRWQVENAYQKARKLLGWTKENDLHFSFHGTRHTYGSWLAQDGVNSRMIQGLMGHSSISTTEIYMTLTAEHGREALDKLPPISAFLHPTQEDSSHEGVVVTSG